MRILVMVPVLWILLLWGCGGDPGPPSFVLVSLDTTRSDSLSLFGYPQRSTPLLDALGREGLVFEQTVTVSENTLVSHASMITGLYPGAHGTTNQGGGSPLQDSYQTMAEDFAAAGYQTAGFVGISTWLNENFGFTQGFDAFTRGYRTADAVLADARKWADQRDPERPFFLFIHLFDVHSQFKDQPYSAPEPYSGLYTGDYAGPLTPWVDQAVDGSKFLLGVANGSIRITEGDLGYLRRLYDEGLGCVDFRLGRFLKELATSDNTYFVVTSDHGEEFLEHGKMLHTSHYDEVVKVPLIIVPPLRQRSQFKVPRFISEQVGIVDIRPTLLSFAGLPAPVACQGADLTPWLKGLAERCPSKPAVIRQQGLRHDGFKLMRQQGRLQLYDLDSDPGECTDLAGRPDFQEQMLVLNRLLWRQIREDGIIRKAHSRKPANTAPLTDKKTDKMLRDLGYVQ